MLLVLFPFPKKPGIPLLRPEAGSFLALAYLLPISFPCASSLSSFPPSPTSCTPCLMPYRILDPIHLLLQWIQIWNDVCREVPECFKACGCYPHVHFGMQTLAFVFAVMYPLCQFRHVLLLPSLSYSSCIPHNVSCFGL